MIEKEFERRFIPDSYANRRGKGSHRALDRCQQFARRYRYVLRLDIVQHFPSIDHAILLTALCKVVKDHDVVHLMSTIIHSGRGILDQEYDTVFFAGDDLLSICRPRGLPIGNLTSQFWSNCYLHAMDLYIKRTLGCKAYLRYVDDFVLFSNHKGELWEWKKNIIHFLETLRLTVHEGSAQVAPVAQGIPWLGFIIYPHFRRIKARKVREASRRLGHRFDAWHSGLISFGEFDASMQGWINHVRYADSWRLRERVLEPFVWRGSDWKK